MPEENIKQFIEEEGKKTRRHFDVAADGLKHNIQLVAERVTSNGQKIDRMQKDVSQIGDRTEVLEVKMVSMETKVESIENNIEIIKTDIEFIKHGLKQKIDREEFAVLEKRVAMLEAKANGVNVNA